MGVLAASICCAPCSDGCGDLRKYAHEVRQNLRTPVCAQVMMYNSWRDGMDVSVKHLVPEKLPPFVLQKASEAQQAAKAITQAAEVR